MEWCEMETVVKTETNMNAETNINTATNVVNINWNQCNTLPYIQYYCKNVSWFLPLYIITMLLRSVDSDFAQTVRFSAVLPVTLCNLHTVEPSLQTPFCVSRTVTGLRLIVDAFFFECKLWAHLWLWIAS